MILQGLVKVCILAFSDRPPVFMKPAERMSMAEGPIVPLLNHSGVLGTPQGAGALPRNGGGLQSNCKGNRKSLLIGIEYLGTPGELRGCINNINNVKKLIVQMGFPSSTAKMRVLTDDTRNPETRPTRKNIIDGGFHRTEQEE